MIVLTNGQTLRIDESLGAIEITPSSTKSSGTLAEIERNHIVAVLEESNWRIEGQKGAALRLGLNANTLRSRMQKLGIKRPAAGAISEL